MRQAPMLKTPNPNVMYRPNFFFQPSRSVRKIESGKIKMKISEEKWRAQVVVQRIS